MGEITITAKEYRELVIKAYKYEKLRKKCVAGKYFTMEEDMLFDITDEEKEEMKERSYN